MEELQTETLDMDKHMDKHQNEVTNTKTPRNAKRTHKEIASPNSSQEDHAGAPRATRRRNSIGSLNDITQKSNNPEGPMIIGHKGKTFDLSQLVQTSVTSPPVVEAIAPVLVSEIEPRLAPLISQTVEQAVGKALKTALDKMDGQSKVIEDLTRELKAKLTLINDLQEENKTLKTKVGELEAKNTILSENIDDLEQYGRRNSLRFHNVEISPAQARDTDEVLVKLLNEKLSLNPPLITDDIERSHLIGRPNEAGRAQVICKFKAWKTKSAVYRSKKKLKENNRNTMGPKLFISEDLTKPRQTIVKQLAEARRTGKVNSYWTSDGRIFYKLTAESTPVLVKSVFGDFNL